MLMKFEKDLIYKSSCFDENKYIYSSSRHSLNCVMQRDYNTMSYLLGTHKGLFKDIQTLYILGV